MNYQVFSSCLRGKSHLPHQIGDHLHASTSWTEWPKFSTKHMKKVQTSGWWKVDRQSVRCTLSASAALVFFLVHRFRHSVALLSCFLKNLLAQDHRTTITWVTWCTRLPAASFDEWREFLRTNLLNAKHLFSPPTEWAQIETHLPC